MSVTTQAGKAKWQPPSKLGDEKMPDFVDGVDDFQKLRWLHQRERRRKEAKKSLALGQERELERVRWISEGKEMLVDVNRAFSGVEGILGPHRDKKKYCQHLCEIARKMDSEPVVVHYFYAKRLLHAVKPPRKTKKADMIRHWWSVVSEMKRGKDLGEFFLGRRVPNLLRALRIRERGERSLVPIERHLLNELHEKRAWKKKVLNMIDLIRGYKAQHARIPDCQSLLHFTPSGCPVCGVVHIGGSNNLVQFVKSVNRQSGVVTLQKLEYELTVLDEEEATEEKKLAEAEVHIGALEQSLFIRSRNTIQSWWPCVLAKWRAQRAALRWNLSLWYFRIRRLVKMKRCIDSTDENALDFEYLVDEYPDIRDEMEEYLKKVQKKRAIVAERVAKVFLSQLRKAVARARKKEHLRLEKIKAENAARDFALTTKKKELFLLAMRKRVLVFERKRYVCIRPNCCGRKFFSEDRYKTHMGLHKMEDSLKVLKAENAEKRWTTKTLEEIQVDERIKEFCRAVGRRRRRRVGGEEKETDELDIRLQIIKEAIESEREEEADFFGASAWAPLPHLRLSNAEFNTSTYHLELLSISGDVQADSIVCLDKAVVRIGTLPSLECTVVVAAGSKIKHEAQIAKVHCMIYCPFAKNEDAGIVVVDNHTRYGTYLVGAGVEGARKVGVNTTDGTPLVPGDLLCIAVRKNGTASISAVEASAACIVYRVRCKDRE